ncbi:LuxR family transcriptional regulator [Streptomyces sp. NPDC058287]|uniref:helix-turn-helix transcriptional regulator n=1 Tax=unclassified Streptomyces TaxID=2593676 RepID=UPI0036F02DD7
MPEPGPPVPAGREAGTAFPNAPARQAPGERLRAVFGRLEEELRGAETTVSDLVRARSEDAGAAGVETVDGRAAQGRRIEELESGARHTFQAFLTGFNTITPVPATLAAPDPAVAAGRTPSRPASHPGVAYQLLVDRDFLAEPAAVTALDERVLAGEHVRVVDSPLIKLAVADGCLAMVQVSPERALLLRPPTLLLATELFAAAWRHSRPYLREGGDLSPEDRRILQLMLSGLTDIATAKQLGTSPRTVQRRLRALMDLASVTSRLQLGWYAMRNNWV